MKLYKNKTVKVVDSIYCDACGTNCTHEQMGHEYATLEATWGYMSTQDGTQYNIHLCEKCFTEILDSIKKKRKRVLGCFTYPYENDPLEGER